MTEADLTTLPTDSERRVDLEGFLTDDTNFRLYLNDALLTELLAFHLLHYGKKCRKWGRVRLTIERIDE